MPVPVTRVITREPETERYARQTRNATVFIAIIVGLGVLFSIIGGIVVIHEVSSIANPSGDAISSSVCQADPSLAGC